MIVRRLFYVALVIAVALLALSIYTLTLTKGGLQDTPRNHAFGPQGARLVVTAFLDFDCQPCRNIVPIVLEAVKEDGNVLFIPRFVGPLSSTTGYNIRLAYAAGM